MLSLIITRENTIVCKNMVNIANICFTKKAALVREQRFTLLKLCLYFPIKLLYGLLIWLTIIKPDNRCCILLIFHYEGDVALLGIKCIFQLPHTAPCGEGNPVYHALQNKYSQIKGKQDMFVEFDSRIGKCFKGG